MSPRSLDDSRRWVREGTELCSSSISGLDEKAFAEPSGLPGWSRSHLVAHLAANAEAIGNLVRWAATGEPTPMYASAEARAAGIEDGSRRPGDELVDWFARSAAALEASMDSLTEAQWHAEVVTGQGRTVPATEIPWMRAREVMVHAVDLNTGLTFDDLPADFLVALASDIAGKRNSAATADATPAVTVEATDTGQRWELVGRGTAEVVSGTQAAVTSYLAGRASGGVASATGSAPPELPPWL